MFRRLKHPSIVLLIAHSSLDEIETKGGEGIVFRHYQSNPSNLVFILMEEMKTTLHSIIPDTTVTWAVR